MGNFVTLFQTLFQKMQIQVHVRSNKQTQNIIAYRKIPNVSPGLIEVFKNFLGGLYSGGLIFGGVYIRDFTNSFFTIRQKNLQHSIIMYMI